MSDTIRSIIFLYVILGDKLYTSNTMGKKMHKNIKLENTKIKPPYEIYSPKSVIFYVKYLKYKLNIQRTVYHIRYANASFRIKM